MTQKSLTRFARAERLSDAAVHLIGVVFAVAAVPALIVLSVERRGEAEVVMGIAIYGACLLTMLCCSAVYNITKPNRFTPVLKRLDHTAIYLKIAGSFTPLAAMTGGGGAFFLPGIWAVALGGSSLKMIAPNRLRWLGLCLYVGMGWIGVLVGSDIISALSPAADALVVAAGLTYSVGVVFFLWERLPFHTAIWHVFVLAGSILIYAAMCVEVTRQLDPIFTGL